VNSWVNTLSHGEALALIRSPRSSTLPRRLHSNHMCAHTCTLIHMTPHVCTCVPIFTCACRETHVCAHTTRVHVCAYSHVQTLTPVHQSERAALPSMLLYTLSLSLRLSPSHQLRRLTHWSGGRKTAFIPSSAHFPAV